DKSKNKPTPWSLSIIEDKDSIGRNQQAYFTDATVSVRQKDNGRIMTIENRYTDTIGSGVPNILTWSVANWQYDTWYTVSVDNIRYRSGNTGRIQYDVLIDYKNLVDLVFPLEAGDGMNGNSIQGSLTGDNDKDSYQLNLAGTVNFSGTSQFSNMAFFISVYGPDKQLIFESGNNENQTGTFSLDLIAGRYTIVVSHCNQTGTCFIADINYSVQID
ncbi:MAG: hypothetical protein ACU84J_13215, partial [Gammaproteobacteria bacterium]